jgi:hypothetical protein
MGVHSGCSHGASLCDTGMVLWPSLRWGTTRSQPTLRHSGQPGDVSVRGGGRRIQGVATRPLMPSEQAHSHGGAGRPCRAGLGRW